MPVLVKSTANRFIFSSNLRKEADGTGLLPDFINLGLTWYAPPFGGLKIVQDI